MHFIGSHLRDLQHRLYARDETINGRGVREGGWRRTVLAVVLPTLALFCSLQPRAKWAVVQHCRPASACRSLLSPRRSDSSAYTRSSSFVAHYSLLRRARLSPRAPTLIHSQYHTRSSQADHTTRRHTLTSKFTLGNNHHRGLCLPIVPCLFLGTSRHPHLSLVEAIVAADKAGQTSTLMP